MDKHPWSDGGVESRFFLRGEAPKPTTEIQELYLRSQNRKEDMGNANAINKSYSKRAPNNTNIDAERVPKGIQSRCQNTSKMNAKIGIGTIIENQQQLCFSYE